MLDAFFHNLSQNGKYYLYYSDLFIRLNQKKSISKP